MKKINKDRQDIQDNKSRSDNSSLPAPPRATRYSLRATSSGFTLIEVVLALAILAMFIVPLLGSITRGMESIRTMENRSLALRLAQDKMTELRMLTFPEAEGTDDGDFGRDYPDFKWRVEMTKSPTIQLMETAIPTLKGMEVRLVVSWKEGTAEKSVELQTVLLE